MDELSGRLDEVDENRKESRAKFDDALAAFKEQSWWKPGKVSSPERNLGYRRPAYFYFKALDSKRPLLEKHGSA